MFAATQSVAAAFWTSGGVSLAVEAVGVALAVADAVALIVADGEAASEVGDALELELPLLQPARSPSIASANAPVSTNARGRAALRTWDAGDVRGPLPPRARQGVLLLMGIMLSFPLTSYRRASGDIGPCRVEAGAEHEAVLQSASCSNLEMGSSGERRC